jgi:hypothetical protein
VRAAFVGLGRIYDLNRLGNVDNPDVKVAVDVAEALPPIVFDADGAVGLLSRGLRFPTRSGHGGYAAMADWSNDSSKVMGLRLPILE